MKRCDWFNGAGDILAPTLEGYPLEELARDVHNGALELWKFEDGTLTVLERQRDTLYVWAIAGESLRTWAHEIVLEAFGRGCSYIGFRTQRKGLARLLSELRPVRTGDIGDTHSEYRITVAGAVAA